jgi:hypothetical protein
LVCINVLIIASKGIFSRSLRLIRMHMRIKALVDVSN